MGLGCMDVFSMGTDAVKGDSDMRITKEPEVRRQEILDTALRLFGEQGYEKTSIADIARAIGVAQGLCYRYFPSKETLFDSAVEQYADQLVESFTGIQISRDQTLRQMIETMPIVAEDQNSSYYSVFHGVWTAWHPAGRSSGEGGKSKADSRVSYICIASLTGVPPDYSDTLSRRYDFLLQGVS